MDLPHHDIAVVGSGFSGLAMAIALRQAGRHDFVVLERAGSVGGTWRDNHYPGCACDVPTPLYSLSAAPNPDWSHLYARSGELRAYMEDVTDRFGIRPHLRLQTEMTGAAWDDATQRWTVEAAGEPLLTCRMLIGGFGGLTQPSFPKIPGLDSFRGPVFHSADWNHDVELEGKRVAVIGTGASAIQLVPRVARQAEHLTVFQRTPPWVMPKLDHRIPAFERWLFRHVPATQKALRGVIFGITESLAIPITRRPALLRGLEAVARWNIRRAISDPALRRKLTPEYRLGCKRILVANDWYPALARENVTVQTGGIVEVFPRGLVAGDGTEHEVDVIVCGTGFDIEGSFNGTDIRGRDGVSLRELWSRGIEAHRGTTVAGFPNLAFLCGPNTGTGSTSQVYMIESQVHYVMEMLRELDARGMAVAEVRADAQRRYNDRIQARMADTVWLSGGCNSWYLDDTGRNRTLYPGLSSAFRRETRDFRVAEYDLEPVRAPATEPVAA